MADLTAPRESAPPAAAPVIPPPPAPDARRRDAPGRPLFPTIREAAAGVRGDAGHPGPALTGTDLTEPTSTARRRLRLRRRRVGSGRVGSPALALLLFGIIGVVTWCEGSALGSLIGPLARGFHLPLRLSFIIGNAVAATIGLGIAGAINSGNLALDPSTPVRWMPRLLLAQAAALAGNTLVHNGWVALFGLLPVTFAISITTLPYVVLIARLLPVRLRGRALQVLGFSSLGGLGLFNLLHGELLTTWSTHAQLVPFAGVALLGALGLGATTELTVNFIRHSAEVRNAALERARGNGNGNGSEMRMLICRNLHVSYDGVQILRGVDFDVAPGEIVALLGSNGAGKSTLLSAIAGVTDVATGAVLLDGTDVTHLTGAEKAGRGLVMLPGGKAVLAGLTVEDNLLAAEGASAGEPDPKRRQDVYDQFPPLAARRHELAGNLSGGEQQMLAVGQAQLMRPRLLLIDELSLGLAPAVVAELLDTVRSLARSGVALVLVEQSVNVALTVADRAVVLDRGEIRFDGLPDELLGRNDLLHAVFLGTAASATGRISGGGSRPALPSATGPALQVRGLGARFGGVAALTDVDLVVDPGEIVGIIGPNGAGKTTLMDAISGLLPSATGRVIIGGQDVTTAAPHVRARLGLARSFQDVRLFPSLTVTDTLALAMERHFGLRSSLLAAAWAAPARRIERRIAHRVERLIATLNLGQYADKFVNELSTGTRRMVDLGCVLATEPQVLLIDEPASGLAQAEVEELAPLLTRLVRDTGCAAVVIEHDLPLITSVADRLVAMHLGRVIAAGQVDKVLDDPDVVRSYLSAADEVIYRSGASATSVLHAITKKGESGVPDPA